MTQRFLAAAVGGDIEGLMTVLAPDVTLLTDGGGKTRAALRPITGASSPDHRPPELGQMRAWPKSAALEPVSQGSRGVHRRRLQAAIVTIQSYMRQSPSNPQDPSSSRGALMLS